MDSVSHTAALEFTLNWIRARHAVRHRWPFGRFSAAQDVNKHFYNILHLPFPLSKDYNATQTREIERRAKQLKRQIFNEALQQLTRDDDPELSVKAVESLPKSFTSKESNSTSLASTIYHPLKSGTPPPYQNSGRNRTGTVDSEEEQNAEEQARGVEVLEKAEEAEETEEAPEIAEDGEGTVEEEERVEKMKEAVTCFGCCRHFLASDPACDPGFCCSHPPTITYPKECSISPQLPPHIPVSFTTAGANHQESNPELLQILETKVAKLENTVKFQQTILEQHQEFCVSVKKVLRLQRKLNKAIAGIVCTLLKLWYAPANINFVQ